MVPKAANAKSLVAKKKSPANQSATGLDFANFQNAVSAGYFSMLHVFKYLSTKDRLSASKGQLISECLFDVLNFLKKNDKFLPKNLKALDKIFNTLTRPCNCI